LRGRSAASWAIWGPSDRDAHIAFTGASDISFPAGGSVELLPHLSRSAVIIGYNPGNAHDPSRAPWSSHHYGAKHGDHLLAEAFRATPCWGAYLTDVLTLVDSDAAAVTTRAKRWTVSEWASETALFREELEVLGGEPLLICLGAATEKAVKKSVPEAAQRTVRIWHNSPSARAFHYNSAELYRLHVHHVLGAS